MNTPDLDLAQGLLRAQFPELASLPLRIAGMGVDNVIVRVGEALALRLPRTEQGATLIANEIRWLPELAPKLPLPIPKPLHIGRPQGAYPWPWYVTRWFHGTPALAEPLRAGSTLARFLRALHRPAPPDAPHNPYRSIPLAGREARFEQHLAATHTFLDARQRTRVRERWHELSATPRRAEAPTWIHGDLHPANMIVIRGELSAVIDFGDVCAGDPATDLAVAWMLFDRDTRALFRAEYTDSHDDALWRRAQGWAITLGLAALATDLPPEQRRAGLRTVREALVDPEPPGVG